MKRRRETIEEERRGRRKGGREGRPKGEYRGRRTRYKGDSLPASWIIKSPSIKVMKAA